MTLRVKTIVQYLFLIKGTKPYSELYYIMSFRCKQQKSLAVEKII